MKNLKIKFRPLTFGEEVSDTRNEAIQRQRRQRDEDPTRSEISAWKMIAHPLEVGKLC